MTLPATTVEALQRLVAEGRVSARDVATTCLDRIEARDPELRAFLAVTRDDALDAAASLDAARSRGEPSGKLAGVPMAIKDGLCMRGAPTTAGSRILERYVAPYEATVVTRLREAGAILLGKTNMDELGMGSTTEHSAYFPSKNPWDTGRTPGGSSGGSAVAVAARMAVAALGSDTGGSIRQPAAYTGTVGLKPTYGRVSRYGLVAFASSLDQVGTFATDVAGAARVLEVIAGHDPNDGTTARVEVPPLEAACGGSVRGLRVGVIEETLGAGLDPDVRASFEVAVEALGKLGCEVRRVRLAALKHAVATYYVLCTAEASSNLARLDGVRFGSRAKTGTRASLAEMIGQTRDEGFGDEVKRRILLGTFVLSADAFDAYYVKAQRVRRVVRDELAALLSEVDVLASPTAPTVAPRLGANAEDPLAMYLSDVLTLPASLAGLPAISLPSGLSPEGLPIGLQLVGRPFDEATVLRVAAAYEAMAEVRAMEPPR